MEGIRDWEQYTGEKLARAQDVSVARDQTESRSSSTVPSTREDQEGELGRGPEAAGQGTERSRGLSGGRKRSRERNDDDNGEQPSKQSTRPDGSPGPVVREESQSSNGIPLSQLNPLEPKMDLLKDFDLKWQALREQWDEKDRPTWERLYSRSHRLVEANLTAIFPGNLSATAMADFRNKVSKALENILVGL